MDLNDIVIFTKVVQEKSFIKASRALDIPKSTVSRKVAELEERLGARLLQRTTRSLSLTDVGHAYYQHALRVVAELEQAEQAVTHLQATPRGPLRVTIPVNAGFLRSAITSFVERYPDVRVSVYATERLVDLIEERFDVGVRAGHLEDSSLIARKLGVGQAYLVASPHYLKEVGALRTPAQLKKLDWLGFGTLGERERWTLINARKQIVVEKKARMVMNDYALLVQAALDGLGVALLPAHLCEGLLKEKKLKRVLSKWCSVRVPYHAIYPSTRHLSPKVKAFVDHLRSEVQL